MKNYLSFGGGVNSTALLLLLHEQGIEHEAVFVDHGGDWPETYEYVEMLRQKYPITVIRPSLFRKKDNKIFDNLVDFMQFKNLIPLRQNRWCTSDFKVKPLHDYFEKPCFVMIGMDAGESHRVKISSVKGIEHRWPLIEFNINRQGCVDLIKRHGLPVPMKSGCWFCPFQRISQLKELRYKHPDLWCKLVALEKRSLLYALSKGRSKHNSVLIKPHLVTDWVNDKQKSLMPEFEYPPCQCGL